MKILRLEPSLRSHIQSGETLADATKCVIELVYNALDAYATAIAVRVNLKTFFVQVVDNGEGIEKLDLNVVGERYMTSKLRSIKELEKRIQTFGYSGKALASMVKLCWIVTIQSRFKSMSTTYEKVYVDGNASKVRRSRKSRPSCGTTVTLENFMYNLPVRQRRVKEVFDLEDIKSQLEYLALAHNHVSFSLRNDQTGVVLLQTNKRQQSNLTFADVFGLALTQLLVPVHYEKEEIKVSGFYSPERQDNATWQLVYVNRRVVFKTRIHILVNALLDEYLPNNENKEQLIDLASISDLSNFYMINVDCPYSFYTMSTESGKTSVHFHDRWLVLKCVMKALKKSLPGSSLRPVDLLRKEEEQEEEAVFDVGQLKHAVRGVPAKRAKEVLRGSRETVAKDQQLAHGSKENILITSTNHDHLIRGSKVLKEHNHWVVCGSRDILRTSSAHDQQPLRDRKILTEHHAVVRSSRENSAHNILRTSTAHDQQVTRASKVYTAHNHQFLRGSRCRTVRDRVVVQGSRILSAHSKQVVRGSRKKNVDRARDVMTSVVLSQKTFSSFPCMPESPIPKVEFKFPLGRAPRSSSSSTLKRLSAPVFHVEGFPHVTFHEFEAWLKVKAERDREARRVLQDYLNFKAESMQTMGKAMTPPPDRRLLQISSVRELRRQKRKHAEEDVKVSNLPREEEDNKVSKLSREEDPRNKLRRAVRADPVLSRCKSFLRELKASSSQLALLDVMKLRNMRSSERDDAKDTPLPGTWCSHQHRASPLAASTRDTVVQVCDASVQVIKATTDEAVQTAEQVNTVVKMCDASVQANRQVTNQSVQTTAECVQLRDADMQASSLTADRAVRAAEFKDTNDVSSCEVLPSLTYGRFVREDGQIVAESPDAGQPPSAVYTDFLLEMKSAWDSIRDVEDSVLELEPSSFQLADTVAASREELQFEPPLHSTLQQPFTVTGRYSFIPRGLSPVFSNPTSILLPALSPSSKSKLDQTVKTDDNSLNHVKWWDAAEGIALKPSMPDSLAELQEKAESKMNLYERAVLSGAVSKDGAKVHRLLHSFSFTKDMLSNLKVVGQLDNKFLVVLTSLTKERLPHLLLLFDQHAVDERIRLEALTQEYRMEGGQLVTVELEPPVKVKLSASQSRLAICYSEQLQQYGLRLTYTHTDCCTAAGVAPACLVRRSKQGSEEQSRRLLEQLVNDLVVELVETLSDTRGVLPSMPSVLQEALNMEACRGAVKFNQTLTVSDMETMLQKLALCQMPFQCAHGRPSLVPLLDLDQLFQPQDTEVETVNYRKFLQSRNPGTY